MSTSQVTFGVNLIKCQLLMSTSTVILARILQSVHKVSTFQYCTNISIHIGQYQYCGLLRYWQYQYIHSSSIVLPNMGWGRINTKPYQSGRHGAWGRERAAFAVRRKARAGHAWGECVWMILNHECINCTEITLCTVHSGPSVHSALSARQILRTWVHSALLT